MHRRPIPSAELLLSAKPDLVLASAAATAHGTALCWNPRGSRSMYFQVNSFPEYLDVLGLCGYRAGRPVQINGLRQAERIDEVKRACPGNALGALLLRASSG